MRMHVYDIDYENMVLSRAIEVVQCWQVAKAIHLALAMLQKMENIAKSHPHARKDPLDLINDKMLSTAEIAINLGSSAKVLIGRMIASTAIRSHL